MAQAQHNLRAVACKRIGLIALLLIGWMSAGVRTAHADAPANAEYQVKAALLLNFAQYVQWPAEAFGDAKAPIVVGVLGDDPFGQVLEQTFQEEQVQGRKLVVKRSGNIDDLKSCHLLFVSRSEKEKLSQVRSALDDSSVLVVGDMDDFVQHGGVINFYIDRKKVRFEINADAAERRKLKISSQLLKRAKVVASDTAKAGD